MYENKQEMKKQYYPEKKEKQKEKERSGQPKIEEKEEKPARKK